jgi:hypothetical protein
MQERRRRQQRECTPLAFESLPFGKGQPKWQSKKIWENREIKKQNKSEIKLYRRQVISSSK